MKKAICTIALLPILCVFMANAQDTNRTSAWETKVIAGINMSRGNTRNILINGGFVSNYKQGKNEAKIGTEANYGETEVTQADNTRETARYVQNAKAFAEYRRLQNDRTYWYLNSDIRNDEIADIDYLLTVGPGLGHYLIKSDTQAFRLEAGSTHVRKKLAGKGTDNFSSLRVAQNYEWKASATSRIWASAEYLTNMEDSKRYLINAEIGVEASINKRVSLRLVLQDNYNRQPAPDKKSNDVLLIGGVTCIL